MIYNIADGQVQSNPYDTSSIRHVRFAMRSALKSLPGFRQDIVHQRSTTIPVPRDYGQDQF
jgi:hypothetical protein